MRLKFELGGYYLCNYERVQLPLIVQPSVETLIDFLNIMKTNNGIIVLDNDQEDNYTPYKLTLYSDGYNYLVMLETKSSEGDISVRTFVSESETKAYISILGETHAESSIVKDFALVIRVFKEFLEKGDVSKNLLN